jgi:hypothetical protein
VELDRSHHEPKEIVMNHLQRIRRLAGILTGMACGILALAAAPAALAANLAPLPGGRPPPGISPASDTPGLSTTMLLNPGVPLPTVPPGWNKHPPPGPGWARTVVVHTVTGGGMPGWQIALIAAGAALLAATAAVLVYRAWTIRRKPATAAA